VPGTAVCVRPNALPAVRGAQDGAVAQHEVADVGADEERDLDAIGAVGLGEHVELAERLAAVVGAPDDAAVAALGDHDVGGHRLHAVQRQRRAGRHAGPGGAAVVAAQPRAGVAHGVRPPGAKSIARMVLPCGCGLPHAQPDWLF
jgi:hypothetical protein